MPKESYVPTPVDEVEAEDKLSERARAGSNYRESTLRDSQGLSKLDDSTFNEIITSYKVDPESDKEMGLITFNARGHKISMDIEGNQIQSVFVNGMALEEGEKRSFLRKYQPVVYAMTKLAGDPFKVTETEKALDDLLR